MRIFWVLFILGSSLLCAQPHSPEVVSGSATLSLTPNRCDIVASDRAIINWDSFSISADESTYFSLPSEKSVVLNRVTGSLRSDILGLLKSNGELVLINPNGIFIGSEGVVDAAAFIGSTLDVLNEDFLRGQELLFSGESENSILNLGTITSRHGDLVLLSRRIENKGCLNAENGGVHQGAGRRIFLAPKGDRRITIEVGEGSIDDEGSIRALNTELCAQNPYELAIHVKGEVEAVAGMEKDGRIYLIANEGRTTLSGSLIANGGEVQLLGTEVVVDEGSSIDVSGINGGGSVLIGGDYQGQNPAVMNASFTYVGPNVSIKADALESGNGGKVIVWADRTTDFYGVASVCGGAKEGDGGLVEVSGLEGFHYKGRALRSAPFGKAGTLLLDPEADISIQTAGPTSGGAFAGGVFTPTATTSIIQIGSIGSAGTLLDELNAGNVVINTAWAGPSASPGDVTVVNSFSWGGSNSLTINCARTFTVSGGVTIASTGSGDFFVNANSGGLTTGNFRGIIIESGSAITTVNGDIILNGKSGDTGVNNHGIHVLGTLSSSGTGAITLTGVASTGVTDANYGIYVHGGTITSVNGAININGTSNGSGTGNNGIRMDPPAIISSTGLSPTAATITIVGTVSAGAVSGNGINYFGSTITSAFGDILMQGMGGGSGGSVNGLVLFSGTISSTGTGSDAANITIEGTGCDNGTSGCLGILAFNPFLLSTVDGDVMITGQGGNFSGTAMHGMQFGGTFQSTGTGSNAGTITINATAGSGVSTGSGISWGNGNITSVDGDITINAQGAAGSGSGNAGFSGGAGTISSTGTTADAAKITINGVGGTGTSQNYGILLSNIALSSVAGDITLDGTGGNGTTANNAGVNFSSGSISSTGTSPNAAAISISGVGGTGTSLCSGVSIAIPVTTVDGTITIDGTGGGTTTSNIGVVISNSVSSTGTGSSVGDITIMGQGSITGTSGNHGIQIASGALLTTVDANIVATGIGGGNGTSTTNHGISFLAGSVSSTGVTNNAGTITFNGQGGSGSVLCLGINSSGGSVTSVAGDIDFTGIGNSTGSFHEGIAISNTISSTGLSPNAATITLNGTGGPGTQNNNGVTIRGLVTSVDGAINVIGQGSGTTTDNYGIQISNAGKVTSTGAGVNAAPITLNGTASPNGTTNGIGIYAVSGGTQVTSVDGDIELTGIGLGSSSGCYGVRVASSAEISATGTGNIVVDGSCTTSGASSNGVSVQDANSQVSTVSGNITITGQVATAVSANAGITVTSGGNVSSTSGLITFNGSTTGGGSQCKGIVISGATSLVTTATGSIDITGLGSGNGSSGIGTEITNGGRVTSTGIGAGPVVVRGTGSSAGTTGCHGTSITITSAQINSVSGDISVLGTAGGTTTVNHGIFISTGRVRSTGVGVSSATITLNGLGSATGSSSSGIAISSAGAVISVDGAISLTGTGAGPGTVNSGINVTGSSIISSTGSAPIEIIGLGSATGGDGCHGFTLSALSSVTTVSGDVTGTSTGRGSGISSGIYLTNSSMSTSGSGSYDLVGLSLATGNGSCGVLLDSQAEMTSSGAGSLSLDGTGGPSGTSSYGLFLTDSSTSINSDTATISLIGRDSGGTEKGILITNSADVTSNVSAPITIATFSDMDLTEGGQVVGSSGQVTLDVARDLNITGGSGAGLISGIILANGNLSCSTGRDLTLTGGSGAASHAQIGSRSSSSTANISFPLISGSATINGANMGSFALIGHGDETLIGTGYSGNITFADVRGNISLQGANTGTGALGFGQVGHLNAVGSTISGNIDMKAMGSIFVTGGAADPVARARIGHGGVAGVGTFNASEMTLIANFNFEMNSPVGGGTAEVINLSQQPGSGNLTIVVDNEFPTSPLFGTGSFVLNSTLSATGELRIYTVQPSQNTINDLINGAVFVASPIGVDTNDQQYGIYFPGGTYIGPDFMVYYKFGEAQMMMMQMVDVIDLQIAESQLQTLLPVFLYMRLPFYPWHHPSFCMYERCDPGFDPYGSFIFEDDAYWVGAKK